MKHTVEMVVLIVLATALAGCLGQARQPQLSNAVITPAELKPGDTAVITVRVKDRFGIVQRVEGAVKQEPRLTFSLKDDGATPGDAVAHDGIWSLQVEVPFQAAPGEYELDLSAYDSRGNVITVRNPQGNAVPLMASIPVSIHLAQQ